MRANRQCWHHRPHHPKQRQGRSDVSCQRRLVPSDHQDHQAGGPQPDKIDRKYFSQRCRPLVHHERPSNQRPCPLHDRSPRLFGGTYPQLQFSIRTQKCHLPNRPRSHLPIALESDGSCIWNETTFEPRSFCKSGAIGSFMMRKAKNFVIY